MGHLLGTSVRFDLAHDVMAAGEGIETMLSLRCVMPTMPMVAAVSAAHLAANLFPVTLRRLYIVRDDDPAGDGAMASLIDRTNEARIEAITLSPRLEDFNEDLRPLGVEDLRAVLRTGFEPQHISSPTEHVLAELQLYGYRPFQDEPDPRPLPDVNTVAVADIFDALVVTLADTRPEPDLEDLLWSTVNLFHRVAGRIERELDDNEQANRRSQRELDDSSATSPPSSSRTTPAHPGGPAQGRCSTIAR